MTKNSYLPWLDDESLFFAIKHVYDKYTVALQSKTLKDFTSNIIDPFTFLFDISLTDKDPEIWIAGELERQLQKTLNNAVGEFHQIILGSCQGWEDLGIGDDSHLDIKKTDGTIFAEIKNKYNTMNSSSTKSVYEKLDHISKISSSPTAYLVQIIRSTKKPYNEVWNYQGNTNTQIRRVSGDTFYGLVTKETNALKQLYLVLPRAIKDFIEQQQVAYADEENSVIKEIEEKLGKNIVSSSDLITYFFDIAYPNKTS